MHLWRQKNPNRSILLTLHKTQLQWIKDLSIKPDTLKLTEEKVGNSLELIGTGKDFLKKTPLTWALRSTINKGDLIKLKNFSMTKNTIIQTKQQVTA